MDKIIILDFGSQYNQLIARRVRELGVYSEIKPYSESREIWMDETVKGVILSGGPNSVYDADAPLLDTEFFSIGIPILGICYGMQLTQYLLGGTVSATDQREYGKSELIIQGLSSITQGIPEHSTVWMSHGDHVERLATGFKPIAQTQSCIAAAVDEERQIYNLQFHPEVTHTEYGKEILSNFVLDICKASPVWNMDRFIEESIEAIRSIVQDKKVLLGLSGGVDSSVAAMLIHSAIGDNLTCAFVDTGLLRKNEVKQVMSVYRDHFKINIEQIDASDRFLSKLNGVKDPEEKRKIIGREFIETFEDFKRNHSDFTFLAQGTIYPDVIESVSVKGPSQTIKSHHNVGGLPEGIQFQLLEPLRDLFKDEVRQVGLKLGIPKHLIMRHPFPGPGLGIRILGEVIQEKVEILQNADEIFIRELTAAGLYEQSSQAFVVLLPVKSVGVMGDKRTYEYVAAIRSVSTQDYMTASFSRLPYDFLDRVASMIINEVKGINRVVYDITSKPPGTIEWE